MWTVREEQVEVFRQHHLRQFENSMVLHLAKFAPKHWKVIGESVGREVIRLGIEQARQYGFTTWGPVRFYLDLMFVFGSYFDTDPQLPWVGPALQGFDPLDQMVRAEQLFAEFKKYMARVRGPKHEYFIQALRRLEETPVERLVVPGIPLEESAVQAFQKIYPQACDYLGQARLRTVIQQGFGVAFRHGLLSDKAMLLMTGLSCFMGHGFVRDPLCGWIARRLDPARFPDLTKRTEELYTKAILYMNHVLPQSPEVRS